jgi:hypothetical protein
MQESMSLGGMGLEFGQWRWALVECKNKQQPANFGTKTTAYFGEKPSQWATFANLIFTEPHPAAPHTLNDKPNPEKKNLIQIHLIQILQN